MEQRSREPAGYALIHDAWLRHKSASSTGIYARISSRRRRDYVEKLERSPERVKVRTKAPAIVKVQP